MDKNFNRIPVSVIHFDKDGTVTDVEDYNLDTANMDGYAVADRYTAVATYTGSATSSYVKG